LTVKNNNCFRFLVERGSYLFYNDVYFFLIFYFSVYKITPRETLRFLNSYPVSDSKFHLVGTLMRSLFDIIESFLMRKEKLPKMTKIMGNLRFRQIDIIYFFVISILINKNSWIFQRICSSVLYLCKTIFKLFYWNLGYL
jgi:hypothetical protein